LSAREPTNAELLAAINAIDAKVTGLDNALEAARGQFNDRTEQILVSINSIREDLTVLGGANDRLRRLNENTRDEGRDVSTALANIERILLKHGTRLDDLEKRTTKP
jgi:hypothetical protein